MHLRSEGKLRVLIIEWRSRSPNWGYSVTLRHQINMSNYRSPAPMKHLMFPAESPNQTRMLHSNSVLKQNNLMFELGSNSGEKEEAGQDLLHNLGDGMKFRKRARYLFNDFENTESMMPSKMQEGPKSEPVCALTKVKQSQACKNMIK